MSLIHESHSSLHTLINDHASALCNNHKNIDSPCFTSDKDLVETAETVLIYDQPRDVKCL